MHCTDTFQLRTISKRPSVGATAEILQEKQLYFAELTIVQPTLVVVTQGTKKLSNNSCSWVVHSGEAIAICQGMYDIENSPGRSGVYEASWLTWDSALLKSFAFTLTCRKEKAIKLKHLTTEFRDTYTRARSVIQNVETVPNAIAQHRLLEILAWLDELGVNFSGKKEPSLSDRIRELVSAEPGESWKSLDVARRLNMSEATLRRHLAGENTTYSDLLADTRMSHALSLLQSTDQPVGVIARDVGYESASRFALRFRKRFGFAPTAIRGHKRKKSDVSRSISLV